MQPPIPPPPMPPPPSGSISSWVLCQDRAAVHISKIAGALVIGGEGAWKVKITRSEETPPLFVIHSTHPTQEAADAIVASAGFTSGAIFFRQWWRMPEGDRAMLNISELFCIRTGETETAWGVTATFENGEGVTLKTGTQIECEQFYDGLIQELTSW